VRLAEQLFVSPTALQRVSVPSLRFILLGFVSEVVHVTVVVVLSMNLVPTELVMLVLGLVVSKVMVLLSVTFCFPSTSVNVTL